MKSENTNTEPANRTDELRGMLRIGQRFAALPPDTRRRIEKIIDTSVTPALSHPEHGALVPSLRVARKLTRLPAHVRQAVETIVERATTNPQYRDMLRVSGW